MRYIVIFGLLHLAVAVWSYFAFVSGCHGECVGGFLLLPPLICGLLIMDSLAVGVFVNKEKPRGAERVVWDCVFILFAFGAISFALLSLPVLVVLVTWLIKRM
jgi:hypothetical protein